MAILGPWTSRFLNLLRLCCLDVHLRASQSLCVGFAEANDSKSSSFQLANIRKHGATSIWSLCAFTEQVKCFSQLHLPIGFYHHIRACFGGPRATSLLVA